ncbi:MAG: hypothetical protein U0324_27585 [Polyangiales bacterium]
MARKTSPDELPTRWRWIASAEPSAPLEDEAPHAVAHALGHKRVESLPRRPCAAGSVFWSAAAAPDLALLPRAIRLTVYGGERQAQLAALLDAAAMHPWLQHLAVIDGGLTALPPAPWRPARLYALSFERSELREAPAALGALPRLRALELSGNPIERVAPELADAPLRWLSVGGSSYAPAPLDSLPALGVEKLSLAWAPRFTTALARFPRLRALALHGAVGPDGLPADLGDLASLRHLALAYSPRDEVPAAARRLADLETLALPYGAFTRLPAWLPELRALRGLAVFGCAKLDPDGVASAVASLPALRWVFLPFPFPDGARKALRAFGFASRTGNPSVMERGGEIDDPFPEIR